LQTRRLIAGDSISLDEDKSFYCVVDGTVQVFAQTGGSSTEDTAGTSWDEEDTNGYRLLNEVKSGGTLSSLFTILSLFTEDVHISWQDNAKADKEQEQVVPEPLLQVVRHQMYARRDADVPQLELNPKGTLTRRQSSASSQATVQELKSPPPFARIESVSPPRSSSANSFASRAQSATRPASDGVTPARHGTVARATEDSTLAVIPAEAFRKLTKKFPKATAHIVQGFIFLNHAHLKSSLTLGMKQSF
jgi:lysophospholipid hydrolase